MENNTILVIDDDRNILAIIELYLKKAGFQVFTCADGTSAMAAFHETRPSLVVLDIMLPGRDGWAVTLLTAAVLNDQDRLRDGGDLAADYQDYWQGVLPGTRLVNFFATHRLAGGWQAVRARRHDGYRPFLLTEPGSVFLLQGGDPERMRDLLCGNLPVRGGADWRTCSFVPGNGFGAIALDVIDHAEWAKQVRHVH